MTQDKEKLIVELVNKGLDGDMDSVNACENRIIRGKAKAMIAKVKKGTAERPPVPLAESENNSESKTFPINKKSYKSNIIPDHKHSQ